MSIKKVLFVENDESLTEIYSQYFSRIGMHVDCVASEGAAVSAAIRTRYDVVFADVRLTDGDDRLGLEVAKAIGHLRPETRVFMLTAAGDPKIYSEARRAGVEQCLSKPMPLATMASLIEGVA